MKVKFVPVANSRAEWGNKSAILQRYEGLNIYTLNRWISEMRNNKKFRSGVINPTHKIVFISFEIFEEFLYWKQYGYSKVKAK
ncbi:TPA: DNA-binding protein [Enterococcus faecium]|uniref:DNA-binding protein n=1 Tax=Periweissella fabaria TaxID=546157 RepID=A0ABM8Z3M3_9LACO|nr:MULTISPECIES: DNA-binding protein [Bacilli]NHI67635.1 DNA-binding protein [Lactococcus garvieae]MCM0596474.1 DNA-binding protein [Periweissella fabaria]MDG4587004.1 DNA-binding protein [Enterococcus faecium]MDG4611621.1 DNA-binding protein [Enterococcus lactis]MDG4614175.1 DNA-binding protein [Enterococcus faecium]